MVGLTERRGSLLQTEVLRETRIGWQTGQVSRVRADVRRIAAGVQKVVRACGPTYEVTAELTGKTVCRDVYGRQSPNLTNGSNDVAKFLLQISGAF